MCVEFTRKKNNRPEIELRYIRINGERPRKRKGVLIKDFCEKEEDEEEGDIAKEMMMTKKSRVRRIIGDVGGGDDGECKEDEDNDINEDDNMEKSTSRKKLKEKVR